MPDKRLNYKPHVKDNIRKVPCNLDSSIILCIWDTTQAEDFQLNVFNNRMHDREQKYRIIWLKEGDKNTAFFHTSVKSRINQNKIGLSYT